MKKNNTARKLNVDNSISGLIRDIQRTKQDTLTIIIKSLNEEEHIARCIESCLRTVKRIGGEVILVDSLSSDRTIDIAKSYKIRIVQITDKHDRSCGIGPQLGYQLSKGKYICIIDADMVLNEQFIEKALESIKDDIAGVGGIIEDAHENNIISKMANKRKSKQGFVNHIPGIAVYSRQSLESVGYMANPHLHSNEEAELGYRLIAAGYKLIRLPIVAVKHYRDDKPAFEILKDKWKNRYLQGGGEVLRSRIGNKDFWMHLQAQKLYVATILVWMLIIITLIIDIRSIIITSAIIILFYIFLSIKKRGLSNGAYSLLAWNMTAIQIIAGFIRKQKRLMIIPDSRYKIIR